MHQNLLKSVDYEGFKAFGWSTSEKSDRSQCFDDCGKNLYNNPYKSSPQGEEFSRLNKYLRSTKTSLDERCRRMQHIASYWVHALASVARRYRLVRKYI